MTTKQLILSHDLNLDDLKEALNEFAEEQNYGEIKTFNQMVNFCENNDVAGEFLLC